MLDEGTIPHLLLSGYAGTGKTALAFVIINELHLDPTDLLVINASEENSVEVMREKIKSFVTTFAMGDFKVVLLEEADYISLSGQSVLRRVMEEFEENARFILTCNYENKITTPIKSRSQHFRFKKPDLDDVTEMAAKVLIQEQVVFDLDLLDKYVRVGYPDMRKIINMLQQYTHDGKLLPLTAEEGAGDYKFELLDLIETDDWKGAREAIMGQITTEEWPDIYEFISLNLHKAPKFSADYNKWAEGQLITNQHMVDHTAASVPEMNGLALFLRLGQL